MNRDTTDSCHKYIAVAIRTDTNFLQYSDSVVEEFYDLVEDETVLFCANTSKCSDATRDQISDPTLVLLRETLSKN